MAPNFSQNDIPHGVIISTKLNDVMKLCEFSSYISELNLDHMHIRCTAIGEESVQDSPEARNQLGNKGITNTQIASALAAEIRAGEKIWVSI